MSDYEIQETVKNAALGYADQAKFGARRHAYEAFIAGVKWARGQWPITPQTAHEDRIDAWVGSLEGQANRNYRELMAMLEAINKAVVELLHKPVARFDIGESLLAEFQSVRDHVVDVGQKVEAVISLVDDLDELIRSEDGKPEEARPDIGEMMDILETDEAHRPAVGMFGIGGDASVVSFPAAAAPVSDARDYEPYPDQPAKRPTPTLHNVLKAIEEVRALSVDAGISFDFTISTEA